MSAAILRPMLCPTPSWQSTRGTVFMRTENSQAHPWILEDVGLRCSQAADLWESALDLISGAVWTAGSEQKERLRLWHGSLAAMRRRAVAHSLRLRATTIAIAARPVSWPGSHVERPLSGCRSNLVRMIAGTVSTEVCSCAGLVTDAPRMDAVSWP